MYVAVKGGETAIANAHRLLADKRRGDRDLPAMTVTQIVSQLSPFGFLLSSLKVKGMFNYLTSDI